MALRTAKHSVGTILGKKVPKVEGPATAQIEPKPPEQKEPPKKQTLKQHARKPATKAAPFKSKLTADDDLFTLQLRLRVPARGVSKQFDKIAEHAGEKKAMSVLITMALSEHLESLAAGEHASAVDFERGDREVQTSRRLPVQSYEKLKEIIDPLGIETPFKIGNEIVNRALRAHFSKGS